jgi:hypothetical protein
MERQTILIDLTGGDVKPVCMPDRTAIVVNLSHSAAAILTIRVAIADLGLLSTRMKKTAAYGHASF